MEALTDRHADLIATANADPSPSDHKYVRWADDLVGVAREMHDMNRPPAAGLFVEQQASYLINVSYAFRAAALGNDNGIYLDGADREYDEAERLRVEANLACAGR